MGKFFPDLELVGSQRGQERGPDWVGLRHSSAAPDEAQQYVGAEANHVHLDPVVDAVEQQV